jgi:cellulose synthase/poly-beta-1,6-N-acetylglucosamine synthase-like glycosyltransferase
MIENISRNGVKIKWLTDMPPAQNKFALLIPQYNEASSCDFEKRMAYFGELSGKYKNEVDVILIDDGSTDDSLKKIKCFLDSRHVPLHVASVHPNANKVGALFLAALSISHEFVILSDFDTDIENMEKVGSLVHILQQDDDLMGCYFRMIPHDGKGHVFLFQQMEYSLLRSLYTFHRHEKSVTVMPGAGSLFKRDVLISIYSEHSGFRNGEDREATQIGHKLGYKALYVDHILALTRPPLSLKALIRQRVRWNLGYLETFLKEKKYYLGQAVRFTKMGIRLWIDLFVFSFLLLLPALIITLVVIRPQNLFPALVGIYLLCLTLNAYLLLVSPKETNEIRGKGILLIFLYPFMKLTVDYCGWMGAVMKMLKKK